MKSICKHFVVLTLFGTTVGLHVQSVEAQTRNVPGANRSQRSLERAAERAITRTQEVAERQAQQRAFNTQKDHSRKLTDARQRRHDLLNSKRDLTQKQKRKLRRDIKTAMNQSQGTPFRPGHVRPATGPEAKAKAKLNYDLAPVGNKEKAIELAANADRFARPLPVEQIEKELVEDDRRATMRDMTKKITEARERFNRNITSKRSEISLLRDQAIREGSRSKLKEASAMEDQLNIKINAYRQYLDMYSSNHSNNDSAR